MKKKNINNEADEENDKKVIKRNGTGIRQSERTCQDLRFIHEQLCAPHCFRAASTATVV